MPSFITDYLLYNEGNEAPKNYHIWTALSVLASATGPKVYFDYEYIKIFCNLFMVLVGEQGNGKTFAKDIGLGMLKKANPDQPIAAERTSNESIVDWMSKDEQSRVFKNHDGQLIEFRPLTIMSTELKVFVSVNPIGMFDFLTAIYDRTGAIYETRYRNQGEYSLVNPYVSFLACETPEWLTYRLKESVISGGFGRRTMFIYEITDQFFNKTPRITPEMHAAYGRCVRHLELLKSFCGVSHFAPGVDAQFTKWKESRKMPADSIVRGYMRSKHVMALKLATLFGLGTYPPSLQITLDCFEMALQALAEVEPNMFRLFQGVGSNPLVHPKTILLNALQAMGGIIEERKLKVAMFQSAKDVDYNQIMTHLIAAGEVVKKQRESDGVIFVLTPQKLEEFKLKGMTK